MVDTRDYNLNKRKETLMKFERADGRHRATRDDVGTVRISINLKDKTGKRGNKEIGNITRYLSIANTKVSIVYDYLNKILFSESK